MRYLSCRLKYAGASAALAILCSWSGRGLNADPLPPQQQTHSSFVRAAVRSRATFPSRTLAFVADGINSAVYVFNRGGAIVATLEGNGLDAPSGLAIDPVNSDLYVANTTDILVYSSLGPPAVLSNEDTTTTDVAVDRNGYVAALGSRNIECFAPGATSPTKTIPGGVFSYIYAASNDPAGNLFIIGFNRDDLTVVGEVAGGCASGTGTTILQTSNLTGTPADIVVDGTTGNITIDAPALQGENVYVYTYAPPANGVLALKFSTTLYGNPNAHDYAFAMQSRYVVTTISNVLYLFDYPHGGSSVRYADLPAGASAGGVAILPNSEPL